MSERDIALYLEDMLEFAGFALEYSSGLTEASLTMERMRYDAILRNIELIGEAATHVPHSIREQAPEVPWQKIVGARNRIAHGYLGIAHETVWNIVDEQLPALVVELRALIERLPPGTDRSLGPACRPQGRLVTPAVTPAAASETPAPRARAGRGT